MYLYDALLCAEKDFDWVAKTMNQVILKHGWNKNKSKNDSFIINAELVLASEEIEVVSDLKYALYEIVSLYAVLPLLSMDTDNT